MSKLRPAHLLWLVAMVFVAGALSVAASVFLNVENVESPPWRALAVKTVGNQQEGGRLLIRGEGLPDALKGLLFPKVSTLGADKNPMDIDLALYQVATDGRLAVATTRDQRLLTIDVAEKHTPMVLGTLKLQTSFHNLGEAGINLLALIGSKAVVVKSRTGMSLVDLSRPEEPKQIDFLENHDRLLDLQVADGKLYLASDTAGLLVATLSDDHLACRKVAGCLPTLRVATDRRYLVAAGHDGILQLYHLDAQGWPQPVGRFKVPEEIRDLVLTGEQLYVCTASGKLLKFMLGSWPQLILSGQLDLQGRPLRLEWMESSKQLFCMLIGDGVAVIDASRPGTPQCSGILRMERLPISMTSRADRLFMSGLSGLKILSEQELRGFLTSQTLEYLFPPGAGICRLLNWHSIVLFNSGEGLRCFAPSIDKRSPTLTASAEEVPFLALPDKHGVRLHPVRRGIPAEEPLAMIPVADEQGREILGYDNSLVKEAFWHDGRVFALTPAKLSVFKVDAAGKVISTEEFEVPGGATKMAWLPAGFVVVAVHDKGLQVIDVRKTGRTRVVGGYPVAKYQRSVGPLKDLLVDGSRLYVARARLGVEIYDLSSPEEPLLLQRIDTPGFACKLALNDGLLFVADKEEGLFIVDVGGRAALPIGSYRLPIIPVDLLSDGTSLFLSNSAGGVLRLPAPRRLFAGASSTSRQAQLTVPTDVPPGHYLLALYDDRETANLPVMLQ